MNWTHTHRLKLGDRGPTVARIKQRAYTFQAELYLNHQTVGVLHDSSIDGAKRRAEAWVRAHYREGI